MSVKEGMEAAQAKSYMIQIICKSDVSNFWRTAIPSLFCKPYLMYVL